MYNKILKSENHMKSNRSTRFQLSNVKPIETKDLNTITSVDTNSAHLVDDTSFLANKFSQAVKDSSQIPANILVTYLKSLDQAVQMNSADIIIRELRGLYKSYNNETDRLVVFYVMDEIKDFLSPIFKKGFERKPERYPSIFVSEIKILDKIIPNFKEVICFKSNEDCLQEYVWSVASRR